MTGGLHHARQPPAFPHAERLPAGVPVRRCGLAEAIAETRDFLSPGPGESGA